MRLRSSVGPTPDAGSSDADASDEPFFDGKWVLTGPGSGQSDFDAFVAKFDANTRRYVALAHVATRGACGTVDLRAGRDHDAKPRVA